MKTNNWTLVMKMTSSYEDMSWSKTVDAIHLTVYWKVAGTKNHVRVYSLTSALGRHTIKNEI